MNDVCVCAQLCPTLQSHGLWPARLLCPWNFPGKNTEGGCHFLLQRIFLTQGRTHVSCISYTGRQILYHCTTWEALMNDSVFNSALGERVGDCCLYS